MPLVLAFIYLLYPMASPWWAAAEGKLPPLQPILSQVHYDGFGNPVVLADRYFHGNPVAAMPNLHAAFPLLVCLVGWVYATAAYIVIWKLPPGALMRHRPEPAPPAVL
ncbi:MAG: hypothetical protein ACYDCQ_17505 [Dehalococcoidia bacterium]